jgi:hypothetical protein
MFIKKENLMKFLKSTVAIVALLAIGSVSAKQVKRTTSAGKISTPISTPAKPTEVSETISSRVYQQISDHISAISAANDRFTQNFMATIKSANISQKEKNTLIRAAEDMYATLMENCTEHSNDLKGLSIPFLPKR